VSNSSLTANVQFISYIMGRTSYILMRWLSCLLYTRPTHLDGSL